MFDFNVALIVPTGIGAKIGGHSGDATIIAKLLSVLCDTVILHPNVVNASDINEMPSNSLYVDGYTLDEFLKGHINLLPVKSNKVLVVCNDKNNPDTMNAVNSARSILGINCKVVELDVPLRMKGWIGKEGAEGSVEGMDELLETVSKFDFDVLAVHTPIDVDSDVSEHYRQFGGVNPWGKVEALASRHISRMIEKPCAHAPVETESLLYIAPARIAPEFIGVHLMSVLKGLSKAPRWCAEYKKNSLSVDDLDALVSPLCWGEPHESCSAKGIPILLVEENTTVFTPPKDLGERVNNYYEAVGWLAALKLGVFPFYKNIT